MSLPKRTVSNALEKSARTISVTSPCFMALRMSSRMALIQLWWAGLYGKLIYSHAIRFFRQPDERAGEISNDGIPLRGQEGLRLVVGHFQR